MLLMITYLESRGFLKVPAKLKAEYYVKLNLCCFKFITLHFQRDITL